MIEERVAKLEVRMDAKDAMDTQMLGELKAIRESLSKYGESLSRYKGFFGGVLFVFTGIYYSLVLGKDWIVQLFRTKTGM